ncbi:WD domain, G-beta repeat, putative [Angomonas deanei]|uniref:WD domain, G-beta repeat, putative n=1 Tax=Angomonas deanei TaxID=59799 RepID=A0A7G2CAQ5_9TRYP|nr:WD domain, G-beta repeat, putative [Angomonas deanei]
MLAKKKAERREAVAASALGKKRERHGDDGPVISKKKKNFSQRKTPMLNREDIISGATDNRASVIKSLGDHIDTRLKEITFEDDLDRQLDADAFNERKLELIEEAQLLAGTAQRAVAVPASKFLSLTADGIRQVRIHHNSNAVTAVASLGTDVVVFGDKTGKVYWVDISTEKESRGMTTGEKRERARRKKILLEPSMKGSVVSIAISDTRQNRPSTRDIFERSSVDVSCTSYIAAGAADGSIGIWDTRTRNSKGLLFMHRKAVTGLSFRLHSSTLRSVSEDGVLRVWSVPQMMMVDSLFGHIGKVFSVHGLRKETCASVGEDGAMRFWKTEAATQQGYSYLIQHRKEAQGVPVNHAATGAEKKENSCPIGLECVTMLNESIVVAGAVDGTLLVFDINKRKPVIVHLAAHGYGYVGDGTGLEKEACALDTEEGEKPPIRQNPNPITAIAAVPYADLIASASYDGIVRLWRLAELPEGGMALQGVAEVPVSSLVNSLHFSPDGDHLYVACSKEPRLGRWVVRREALNSVLVIPLSSLGLRSLAGLSGGIEHVPALLYGFVENDEEEEEEEEPAEPITKDAVEEEEPSEAESSVDQQPEETESSFFEVGEDGQLVLSAKQTLSSNRKDDGEEEDVMKRKKKNPVKKTVKTAKRTMGKGKSIAKKKSPMKKKKAK